MNEPVLSGYLLEEHDVLSLNELCRLCAAEMEDIVEFVNEGILKPVGRERVAWQFSFVSVEIVRKTRRLQQDLGLNLEGAALALELLEEIERLQSRIELLDRD